MSHDRVAVIRHLIVNRSLLQCALRVHYGGARGRMVEALRVDRSTLRSWLDQPDAKINRASAERIAEVLRLPISAVVSRAASSKKQPPKWAQQMLGFLEPLSTRVHIGDIMVRDDERPFLGSWSFEARPKQPHWQAIQVEPELLPFNAVFSLPAEGGLVGMHF